MRLDPLFQIILNILKMRSTPKRYKPYAPGIQTNSPVTRVSVRIKPHCLPTNLYACQKLELVLTHKLFCTPFGPHNVVQTLDGRTKDK